MSVGGGRADANSFAYSQARENNSVVVTESPGSTFLGSTQVSAGLVPTIISSSISWSGGDQASSSLIVNTVEATAPTNSRLIASAWEYKTIEVVPDAGPPPPTITSVPVIAEYRLVGSVSGANTADALGLASTLFAVIDRTTWDPTDTTPPSGVVVDEVDAVLLAREQTSGMFDTDIVTVSIDLEISTQNWSLIQATSTFLYRGTERASPGLSITAFADPTFTIDPDYEFYDQVSLIKHSVAVPEPSTLYLLGLNLFGLIVLRRKQDR